MPLATFQDLTTWTPTIHTLHQAAQVIGRIQATVLPARRNALHLGLEPVPAGLRTQPLPGGRRIMLDFAALAVMVEDAAGSEVIDLTAHTQASLLRVLQERLALTEVRKAETVSGAEQLDRADRGVARAYAEAQDAAFTGIARFRARLEGHLSPVVVWAHHLDVSTLVFSPANAGMDEAKAHLNFGFAPFTEGQYARPYLYAYAYPYPDGFAPPPLPAPLAWNLEAWTGIVVGIDALAQAVDPAGLIEALCEQMERVLAPLLA